MRLLNTNCKLRLLLSSCVFGNIGKMFYHKYKYSPNVEEAINNQIHAEQQAAQDYLSLAVSFLHPRVSRPGAGGFFMKMYHEELEHMHNLVQYQLKRGGVPEIKGLNVPKPFENPTLLDAFKEALDMEHKVTQLLECIVVTAETEKDFNCADIVISVFLKEQMQAISDLSHHVTKLSRLSTEHGIYCYDQHLVKLYPYKPNTGC